MATWDGTSCQTGHFTLQQCVFFIPVSFGIFAQESNTYLYCLTNHYLLPIKEDQKSHFSIELLIVHINLVHSLASLWILPASCLQDKCAIEDFNPKAMWCKELLFHDSETRVLPYFVLNDLNRTEWICARHGNIFRRQGRLLENCLALWPFAVVRKHDESLICAFSLYDWDLFLHILLLYPASLADVMTHQENVTKLQVWLWILFDKL